jgi:hypothetical protein
MARLWQGLWVNFRKLERVTKRITKTKRITHQKPKEPPSHTHTHPPPPPFFFSSPFPFTPSLPTYHNSHFLCSPLHSSPSPHLLSLSLFFTPYPCSLSRLPLLVCIVPLRPSGLPLFILLFLPLLPSVLTFLRQWKGRRSVEGAKRELLRSLTPPPTHSPYI